MLTVFLAPSTLKISVVESQILPLAKSCQGQVVILTSHQPLDILTKGDDNLELVSYKSRIELLKYFYKFSPNYIYVRDPFDFLFCSVLKNLGLYKGQFVYDFRGVAHEEMSFKNSAKWKCKLVKELERLAFKKAEYVSCVSYSMKKELTNIFFHRSSLFVTPCGADFQFKKTVPQKNVIDICYLGGLSSWQKFEQVCETIEKMQHFNKLMFHVFTKDTSKAIQILESRNICINKINLKQLNKDEVLMHLKEMDFGLVFRDDSFINRTSSPIKVSEYICAGVIPVLTESVGDFYNTLISRGAGINRQNFMSLTVDEMYAMSRNQDVLDNLYKLSHEYTWANIAESHIINKLSRTGGTID